MKKKTIKRAIVLTVAFTLMATPLTVYAVGLDALDPSEGTEPGSGSAIAPDVPLPSNQSAVSAPAQDDDSTKGNEPQQPAEPEKDGFELLREQTSNTVAGFKSTTDQINLATVLGGFAVTTPKADLIKDYILEEGEDILVKVSNFDAAKSPDCKKAMDIMAGIEGLSLGPAINFEIGMVGADGKYTAFDDTDCTVAVKIGLNNFENAFGVLEITETGVQILGDIDDDPNTVTVNASCRRSTLVVIKSSQQITEEYLKTLQKELLERLAALSNEQAKIEKAESDKAELNQKIGELGTVQKELADKLTALSNDNRALEQKKVELENMKVQLTKQLEATNKSLSGAVSARDKYEEKYKNATAAPKRRERK